MALRKNKSINILRVNITHLKYVKKKTINFIKLVNYKRIFTYIFTEIN